MSTEAVTPFAKANKAIGFFADIPGTQKLPTDATAELLIGSGEKNYEGAKFKFSLKLNNPLPRYVTNGEAIIKIKADFNIWFTSLKPEHEKQAIGGIGWSDASESKIEHAPTELATEFEISGSKILNVNFYRDKQIDFQVTGLKTGPNFNTPMIFTISTIYKDSAGVKYEIDTYTNI